MRMIWTALAGGLAGFAVVFLGVLGLVFGTVAAAALVLLAITRRDATLPGIAVAAAGGVVAALSARIVVTSFGDPNVSYDLQLLVFMVVGAITAGVGALATLVGWGRRNGRSDEGSEPRSQVP